jgi:RNA-directed DNA polymerase
MKDPGNASEQDETRVMAEREDAPVILSDLMRRVLSRENLLGALQQVKRNKGGPGIDGMTVDQLPDYLKKYWPRIKQQLITGRYRPHPVKRVEIPKPGGGHRALGIPTVTDRFIQQALLQVLQSDWDETFSAHSYGFRPNRSAHQAVLQAQCYLRQENSWVVDMDLEKFFDRVNHDILMHRISQRIDDPVILKLINRILKAGVQHNGEISPTPEGTPQGGPLSPLLANLLLDDLDKELEHRGHRFVRYADDCNIYVKSQRAGERVLSSITRFLEKRLHLKVNDQKSAVDRPWKRSFLGFTFSGRRPNRIKVSEKALKRLKEKVISLTRRTRGHTMTRIIAELRKLMIGWSNYFALSEVNSPLHDLDKWIRRRLRSYHWKQWGRAGYRELRKRGVERKLAWNTCKSAHGPWRLSRSPALYHALPNKYFKGLGLPSLVANG